MHQPCADDGVSYVFVLFFIVDHFSVIDSHFKLTSNEHFENYCRTQKRVILQYNLI